MRHFNRLEFPEAAQEFDRAAAESRGGTGLDAKLARFYSAESHAKIGLAAYKRGDLPRAREEFEKAVCVQGNYPDLYAYLGILDGREGRLADARDWLDHALALSPTQREALGARVVVRWEQGDREAARLDLDRLAELGTPLPDLPPYQARLPFMPHCLTDLGRATERLRCLAMALDHYDRGDWSRALDDLERAIAECPGYPDLHFRRGVLFGELRRRDDAVRAFDAALELHPDYLEALMARGVCLLHLSRPEEALASLVQAARQKPHYADVAYAQAVAALYAGRPEEARAPIHRALTVNPGFWRARLAAALLHHGRGDVDGAVAELAQGLRHHTPEGFLPSREREHALERRAADSASAFWSAMAAAYPDYPDVQFQLGLAELERGNMEAARSAFRHAVQLHSGYAAAHCGLGKTELRAGQPEHSIPHFTRALDLEPRLADVWCLLGEARAETGDLAGAAQDLERALRLNSGYIDALLGLAAIRGRQWRPEDARGLYERVLRESPDHPVARARLAEVGATS